MRGALVSLLVLAGLLLARTASAVDPEDLRPFPAVASGDIPFDVDAARFCTEKSDYLAEYYFRIANRFVQFTPVGDDTAGPFTASLECEIALYDSRGGELETRRDTVEVSRSGPESPETAFQLVTLSYPLNPLAWGVRARVRDLGTHKRGILYAFSGRHRDGEAWARFADPPSRTAEFCVSDIQFAWDIEASPDSAAAGRGRLHIVPNPGRTYGLRIHRLYFYYEVRTAPEDSSRFTTGYDILRDGHSVYKNERASVVSAGGWSMSESVDISNLEAGTYDLRITIVPQEGTGEPGQTTASFNVLWTAASWDMSQEQILNEAAIYLSEDEYRTLEDLRAGDRARFIEEFWKKNDPTPGTPRNETYEKFLARIDYARRQFSALGPGELSDRGRIYVRYGEPDDVKRELIPVEADQLSSELNNDPFLDSELKAVLSQGQSRPHAYEIWSYYGRGDPLFPGRDLFPGGEQIRFIFVDDQGFGEFYLKYSTEHGAIR